MRRVLLLSLLAALTAARVLDLRYEHAGSRAIRLVWHGAGNETSWSVHRWPVAGDTNTPPTLIEACGNTTSCLDVPDEKVCYFYEVTDAAVKLDHSRKRRGARVMACPLSASENAELEKLKLEFSALEDEQRALDEQHVLAEQRAVEQRAVDESAEKKRLEKRSVTPAPTPVPTPHLGGPDPDHDYDYWVPSPTPAPASAVCNFFDWDCFKTHGVSSVSSILSFWVLIVLLAFMLFLLLIWAISTVMAWSQPAHFIVVNNARAQVSTANFLPA